YPTPQAKADRRLLSIALENLLNNAWKFTGRTREPKVEFGAFIEKSETVYFVRDNGAGFDMNLSTRLFTPFERLHPTTEFEGTGVGLATVSRIITRHGGRIWAEGKIGEGATFCFTLPS
ncbi:MAG: sensor histidine kinase, partial [Limisphaerales bacterium]